MMPPENDRRNPFEDHIQSDVFDMSQLGATFDPARLDEQLQTMLNALPQPLDYRLWDEELDDIQKQICAHLTNAIIERFIRPNHQEELGEMSDDDLLMILTVPLALAMLAQQRLYSAPTQPISSGQPPARVTESATRHPHRHDSTLESFRQPIPTPSLPQRVWHWAQQVVASVARMLGSVRR